MAELIWNEDVANQVVGMSLAAAKSGDVEAMAFCMKALGGDRTKREALMLAISVGEKISTLMLAVAGVDKKQPEPVKPVSAYATPVMVSDPTRQTLHELRVELLEAHVRGRRPRLENFSTKFLTDSIQRAMAAVDTLAKVRVAWADYCDAERRADIHDGMEAHGIIDALVKP